MPKQVLDAIPPRPPGFGRHRELFPRTTGDGFDPLSPATVAADVTIGFVLQLDRAARMVAQHAVDPALPGLEEVIDRLTKATFDAPAATPYEAEIRRAEERVLVDRVMWLATGAPNGQVRAIAAFKLDKLAARLTRRPRRKANPSRRSTRLLAADIKRFLERPADTQRVDARARRAARRAHRRNPHGLALPRALAVAHALLRAASSLTRRPGAQRNYARRPRGR